MIDYRQLSALSAVIELQSFEKAADHLCVTQSAISQRIKQLETQIGQLLLIRGQPLRATATGQKLIRHHRQVSILRAELDDLLNEKRDRELFTLPIGLNADSLATWFLEALDAFLMENNLLLDLRVDDQDQTHHLLRQGEVVGCISSSRKPIQGADCTFLGSIRYRAVATPDYLARYFPEGICKKSLMTAPAVEYNQKDELQDRYLNQRLKFDEKYPRHRVPSSYAFAELIERGHAWGMVPDQQSEHLLKKGTLCELTPGEDLLVPLYWHSWTLSSDVVSQLVDCLVDYCYKKLIQVPHTG